MVKWSSCQRISFAMRRFSLTLDSHRPRICERCNRFHDCIFWRVRMGGQGVERREILRYIGIASVAATFPGFSRWCFACPASPSPVPAARQAPASYKALFFSPDQFRLVEHLAEMIIPADDTAGE